MGVALKGKRISEKQAMLNRADAPERAAPGGVQVQTQRTSELTLNLSRRRRAQRPRAGGLFNIRKAIPMLLRTSSNA